jgi:hypothetical protein
MRKFLANVQLTAGTRDAIITTEMAPKPDKKTGKLPTDEERARWQRVRPIMQEILREKGLVEVAVGVVYVTAMRGPLEDGWKAKVEAFAAMVPTGATT